MSSEAPNDSIGHRAKEENYAGRKKANGPLLLKMRQIINRKKSGPSNYINILTLGKLKSFKWHLFVELQWWNIPLNINILFIIKF